MLEALKGKTHWDAKRKCHVPDQPKQGYLTRAVRSFYFDLEIKYACKLAKRCYEKLEKGDFEEGVALKKSFVLQVVAENLELWKEERLCFNSLLMSEPV